MDEDIKKNVLKTGTTTLGLVCKDGIVLAADRRGTFGGDSGVSYIASNDHEKIKTVTDNVIVTIAGVASDTQRVIKLIRAELKLKELRSKSKPDVHQTASLFSNIVYQNIRQPSMIPAITHFLLAGYDGQGFHLYEIAADGLIEPIKDFATSGSGMVQVNPILDSEYKEGITLAEGIKLAVKCINGSMKRDPASGDGVTVYTVTKDKVEQVLKQRIESVLKDEK